MAPKAHHISKAPLNWYKTIERLFSVAFNQSAVAYRRASLCGWRPLSPGAELHTLLAGDEHDDRNWNSDRESGVIILETDMGIRIEIEVPEIKEESLYLEVSGDTLIVRGECVEPLEPSQMQSTTNRYLFQRFIQLPVEAHPGQVQARLVGRTIRVTIAIPN